MKRVWKFPLQATDEQEVFLPQGAELLSVAFQGDNLCMWALINDDPDVPRHRRVIDIAGTGHPLEDGSIRHAFVGTAFHPTMSLVFHVFERL